MLASVTNKASLREPSYITAKPHEKPSKLEQRSLSVQGGIPTERKLNMMEEVEGVTNQKTRETGSVSQLVSARQFSPDEHVKLNKVHRDQMMAGQDHSI